MNKQKRELLARKAGLVNQATALTTKARAENRDFTAEETTEFDALQAQITSVNAAIEREDFLAANAVGAVAVEVEDTARISGGVPAVAEDPKRGFKSFGEFARAVRGASGRNARADERLVISAAAPSTYGNESSGVDGGFAVPPDFSREIWTLSMGEDSLVPYTDQTPVDGNSMVFPKDETVPWGTDGVRAYWQAEASAATQTKPKLGTTTLRLHKLMALVPVTDELLEDTSALGAYLPSKVGDSIRWKTNEAILNGTGAGQPLGALVGAAALTVSKDSGQTTGTLSDTNIANMVARLPPGSLARALWLVNNDVLGALYTLKNSAGYPVFAPFGGGNGAITSGPAGMMFGRPVLISQHANTFSALGDVQLYDLSYYRTITKRGGIETATSMHLYFDADATAFRTIFRIDGQPKISQQISPAKGTNKMSPFLQLQNR